MREMRKGIGEYMANLFHLVLFVIKTVLRIDNVIYLFFFFLLFFIILFYCIVKVTCYFLFIY